MLEQGAKTSEFQQEQWFRSFTAKYKNDNVVKFIEFHESMAPTRNLFKYLKRTHADIEDKLQCSICLDKIPLDSTLQVTPCGHTFHSSCLSKLTKKECPCCRGPLDSLRFAFAKRRRTQTNVRTYPTG